MIVIGISKTLIVQYAKTPRTFGSSETARVSRRTRHGRLTAACDYRIMLRCTERRSKRYRRPAESENRMSDWEDLPRYDNYIDGRKVAPVDGRYLPTEDPYTGKP